MHIERPWLTKADLMYGALIDLEEMSWSAMVGLGKLQKDLVGEPQGSLPCGDVGEVLLLVEIAKRQSDNPTWFPEGKEPTVQKLEQLIQQRVDRLLSLQP